MMLFGEYEILPSGVSLSAWIASNSERLVS